MSFRGFGHRRRRPVGDMINGVESSSLRAARVSAFRLFIVGRRWISTNPKPNTRAVVRGCNHGCERWFSRFDLLRTFGVPTGSDIFGQFTNPYSLDSYR